MRLLAFFLLLGTAAVASAKPIVTVAQDGSGDFNGTDEKPIAAALAEVRQSGGEVWIYPGVYAVNQALILKEMRGVRVKGIGNAELKLRPVQYAEVKTTASVGAQELEVAKQQGMEPEMRLQIMADGPVEPLTGKPKPTFVAKLVRVEGLRLMLAEPLPYAVPAGTRVMNEDAPNLFDLRAGCEGITLESLTLDGGRVAGDPEIPAHAQRCAVFASGPYNYTKGLTGPPLRTLRIRDCTIRNCFGRGVALYAVHDAEISGCTISNTLDEALDVDHFTVNARVVGNRLERARVGVELNDVNDCLVQGNTMEACELGVNLWRWCKMEDLNARNRILDNLLVNIRGHGIRLDKQTGVTFVRGNVIRQAGRHGIYLGGAMAQVSENVIEEPGAVGIQVEGQGNRVTQNVVRRKGAAGGAAVSVLPAVAGENVVMGNISYRADKLEPAGELPPSAPK